MANITYAKHERIFLKTHPAFNEEWLHKRIEEDPSILGLGDLLLLASERAQERAGRLDLLLADPEQDHRYEVELMLGATDESHIIRCIEYWDIERRRYPGYEHCAVLVAEDITSRFLNVVSLLSGTIPLIAIQLNALQVGEHVILDFVKVLDQRMLRKDDVAQSELQTTERSYWVQKSGASIIDMADDLLQIINEHSGQKLHLNYNKYYIGLTDGAHSRNFIYFRPGKKHLRVVIRDGWTDERAARFEEVGLEAEQRNDKLVFNLSIPDLKKFREFLSVVIHEVIAAQDA